MGVDIRVLLLMSILRAKIWCKIAFVITKHEHRSFVVHHSIEIKINQFLRTGAELRNERH